MKKLTSISILGMMLTAASLQAQVDIKITGSTAFRASMFRAITNIFGPNLQNENPGGPTADNSGGNRITYRGTIPSLFGANVVTVYTDMNGSVEGVQSLSQNVLQTYLSNPTNTAPNATNTFTGIADLAFSDVYQSSTPYQSPALRDMQVAIQPFIYTRSVSSPTTVSNITIQQLQPFFANGFMPLSYFTAKASDDSVNVYYPGRSLGSGTRFSAEYDAFFLPGGQATPYAPDSNGVWSTSSGYSSGSGVKGALNQVNAGAAIGTLSISDSMGVNGGLNALTYDGALPYALPLKTGNTAATGTNDYTPVIKGTYSYWCYEHLYERSSESTSGNIHVYRNSLSNYIDIDFQTIYPKIAVRRSEMKVSRPSDGGPITP